MGRRTPLYEAHLAAGATMVDFAGWDMPVHYGSQVAEHTAVRTNAGAFDVSHMRAVDIAGTGAEGLLRRLLANDVARLAPGKALYSVMCNEQGGVLDDVITYRTSSGFRVVVNSATTAKDLDWIRAHAHNDATIRPREDLAILAVQGPNARAKVAAALGIDTDLKPFTSRQDGDVFVARTGYTGEDGLELILPADLATTAWQALLAAGVRPAGLGARDTLRLEAGLPLYGNEMDESVTPLECGLTWTIAFNPADRDFIGRTALRDLRPNTRFVGLILTGRGVMRAHQKVLTPAGEGVITSGTFSPTLGVSIALARIPHTAATTVDVEIRGRPMPADIVRPPFVRNGEPRYTYPEGARA